jgi:hypothetical protein
MIRRRTAYLCSECEYCVARDSRAAAAVEGEAHQQQTGHRGRTVPLHEVTRAWHDGRATADTIDRRVRMKTQLYRVSYRVKAEGAITVRAVDEHDALAVARQRIRTANTWRGHSSAAGVPYIQLTQQVFDIGDMGVKPGRKPGYSKRNPHPQSSEGILRRVIGPPSPTRDAILRRIGAQKEASE